MLVNKKFLSFDELDFHKDKNKLLKNLSKCSIYETPHYIIIRKKWCW